MYKYVTNQQNPRSSSTKNFKIKLKLLVKQGKNSSRFVIVVELNEFNKIKLIKD